MIDLVDHRDFVLVALGNHFVLEGPASAACEFGNDDVAVTEEVDIEIDVMDGLGRVSSKSEMMSRHNLHRVKCISVGCREA